MDENENKKEELTEQSQEISTPAGATEGHPSKKHGQSRDEKSVPKPGAKRNYWALKITVVSFCLGAFFSFLSNLASTAHLVVILLLLIFLILGNIVSDAIGIAVTSCDLAPLSAMAARRVPGARTAIKLVKNAEKVNNICSDVIGDIFGIISGTCTIVVVLKLVILTPDFAEQWWTILISSFVGALTIGGKAYMKNIAIHNAKNFVMFVARIIAVFDKDERKLRESAKRDKERNKERQKRA